MQVEYGVPLHVGLVVLLELELEGVEMQEYLVLVVLALPYLILFYSNLLCYQVIKFINYFIVLSHLLLIISNLFDHLTLTLALSMSPFCYNYYD